MFRKFAVAVSLLALGGVGGALLHAQTAATPAYLIAHVQVTDADGWKQYITALPATLAPYHVKTLARAPAVAMDSSTPPGGSTVIRVAPASVHVLGGVIALVTNTVQRPAVTSSSLRRTPSPSRTQGCGTFWPTADPLVSLRNPRR